MTLATEHRPNSFDTVVGQSLITAGLHDLIEAGKLPPVLLFTGPSGVGKTTVARIVANQVTDSPLDLIEVDAASHGGVAEVRTLLQDLRYRTGNTVLILDEAHSLSQSAFNTLLITLESPPPGVTFILITTESHKIPETIQSRAFTLEFNPITEDGIVQRLSALSSDFESTVDTRVLRAIARRSHGNLRRAMNLFEQSMSAGITTIAELDEMTGTTDHSAKIILSTLSGDLASAFAELDKAVSSSASIQFVTNSLARALSDMLIIQSGGQVTRPVDDINVLTEIAKAIPTDYIVSLLQLIWDLKTKIRSTTDEYGDARILIALMSRIVEPLHARATGIAEAQEKSDDRELSLADLTMV